MKRITGNLFLVILLALAASACFKVEEQNSPENERELLREYLQELKTKGYTIDSTASGVYYVTLQNGTGPFPIAGDTLSVVYEGYLINGVVFDASVYHYSDSTMHYVHKSSDMIKGWDDMMDKMNKGRKVVCIIPSNLAYGSAGSGIIPPYTSIQFVLTMKNIRPKI
jgi:FKBP-type peptidyl-prolyl cis-trans isomerase FkpA